MHMYIHTCEYTYIYHKLGMHTQAPSPTPAPTHQSHIPTHVCTFLHACMHRCTHKYTKRKVHTLMLESWPDSDTSSDPPPLALLPRACLLAGSAASSAADASSCTRSCPSSLTPASLFEARCVSARRRRACCRSRGHSSETKALLQLFCSSVAAVL